MILWDGDAHLGDVTVSAMIHEGGTHSLSFIQYSNPGNKESRYSGMSYQFTAADIDALSALLEKMKASRAEEPRVCEYCGKPASDERPDRDGRVMLVCDFCAEDHDRAAKLDRDERLREQGADQALSEWKERA